MLSSAPNWRENIQLLQNKIYGEEFKDQLITCLNMCNESHWANTRNKVIIYGDIIDWTSSEEHPVPLPAGWSIDEEGFYVYEGGEPNGE